MRIPCPFCGERDVEEFQVLGEAVGPRPDPGAEGSKANFVAYVHVRENPAGPHQEYWYHAAGCRRWLLVARDTRENAVLSAAFAGP